MSQIRYFCLAAAALLVASVSSAEEWVSLEQSETPEHTAPASVTPPIRLAQTQTTPSAPVSTSSRTTSSSPATTQSASTSNSGAVQLLYEELNTLRQEVQSLRDLVEAQSHELRKLKTEQKERYIELDRRMSQVLQGGVPAVATVPETGSAGQGEKAQYDQAFKLIKAKKLPDALLALQAFLNQYPQSPLAVNAYYWTGQIFYIQGQLDEARKAFLVVVNQFPEHQKTADSKLKLGKVYHQLGEDDKAKETLRGVMSDYAQSSPGTARLAENYLNQNF